MTSKKDLRPSFRSPRLCRRASLLLISGCVSKTTFLSQYSGIMMRLEKPYRTKISLQRSQILRRMHMKHLLLRPAIAHLPQNPTDLPLPLQWIVMMKLKIKMVKSQTKIWMTMLTVLHKLHSSISNSGSAMKLRQIYPLVATKVGVSIIPRVGMGLQNTYACV